MKKALLSGAELGKGLGKGYVHIYTGDGKGKTTAAIGLAVRARGNNLKVLLAQLFKSKTSEARQLEKLGVKCLFYSSPHPFFKKYSDDELVDESSRCRDFVRSVFKIMNKEHYDLVILDELGPALAFKLLAEDETIELLKSKPEGTELVMTGRGFPESIISLADYVTKMLNIKHAYDAGVKARKGIEF